MQASALSTSIGSVGDYLAPRMTSTAVSKDPKLATTGFPSGGVAGGFSGRYMDGTTVSNAITIPDDGPGPPSVSFQGPASKKRKRKVREVINISDDSDGPNAAASKSKTKARAQKPKPKPKDADEDEDEENSQVEQRLKKFLERAPYKFQERLDRAISQRMFLMDRERKLSDDGTHDVEIFDIAGTTGNVYEVTINKQPKCTCMDARIKGNQCKHIIYVSGYARLTRRLGTNEWLRFSASSSKPQSTSNTNRLCFLQSSRGYSNAPQLRHSRQMARRKTHHTPESESRSRMTVRCVSCHSSSARKFCGAKLHAGTMSTRLALTSGPR